MTVENTKRVFIDTLEYIRQLVEIRKQPVARLSEYGNVSVTEAETTGLPGIQFCPDAENEFPAWLSLERLHPSAPPELSKTLVDWVVLTKDVDTEPALREWIMRTVSNLEAQHLIGQGIAQEEHVEQSPRDPSLYDVRLFSADNTKLKSEFVTYVAKWKKWAETEKPRRVSIALYQRLFGVHQKMNAGEAERPLELVWGIGHAVWKVPEKDVGISHPLIEILVELSLDSATQTLSVRPRSVLQDKPTINLDIYEALEIPMVKRTKELFNEHLEKLDQNEQSITPDDSTSFLPILETAVTLLGKDAKFWPSINKDKSDRSLPRADETLTITDTWVIFARNKSQNSLSQDIERLQKKANERKDTAGAVAFRFAEEPSNERPNRDSGDYYRQPHDFQSESHSSKDSIIYFPKPYNDAQREIIGRLNRNDGVVVQGPPGTGKTHTIANIICHYLACGKRVLVTAKSETALNVLKDQIPREIQPLVISLVSSDQEGLRQQKEAIQTLQAKVVGLQGRESNILKTIESEEARVATIRKELDRIKAQVTRIAEEQLSEIKVPFEGMGFQNAKDLACWVVEQRDAHQWLQDELGIENDYEPLFSDEDIIALIESKEAITSDLSLNGKKLPSLERLPDPEALKQVHEDLCSAATLEAALKERSFPKIDGLSAEEIQQLEQIVSSADKSLEWTSAEHSLWEREVYQSELSEANYTAPSWLEVAIETLNDIWDLVEEKRAFLRNPVTVSSTEKESLRILEQAAGRKLNGKSLYSLRDRLNKRVKEIVSSVEIVGIENSTPEFWKHLSDFVNFTLKSYELRDRWNAVAREASFEPVAEGEELKEFENLSRRWAKTAEAAKAATECVNSCRSLFSGRLRSTLLYTSVEGLENLKDIAGKNLLMSRMEHSKATRAVLLEELKGAEIDEAQNLLESLRENLGRGDVSSFSDDWSQFYDRLKSLTSLQNHFEDLNQVTRLIAQSGAPHWASELKTQALTETQRAQLATWRDAWRWRRLNGLLASRSGQARLERYEQERQQLESEERRLFESIVKSKTFLALCASMSDRAKAGLAKFTAAVANIGRGTGKKAPYFIRAAQKAMNQCADAVPCWIMPSWRVSEVLPSEFDYFDLVIIDEASQCDVREIPAISRGRKILVVGDDKQVSPTPEFVDFSKFIQLKHNYLSEQPFGDLMLPGYSLYDLAGAVFAGGRIILNEHFRCVEPIIRFSFQFYRDSTGADLILPLRVPKGSERIDPPLVDIHVKDGFKHGETNPPEADAIVAEIKSLVADPAFEKRSIGVISLIGRKQAELIQRLLLEAIGQEAYMRHHIICGDSATFQGRERGIIFLSMVAAKGQRIAKSTARAYEQRFNVAASRARDRMYLVHSVAQEDLSSDDLKSRLLQHFADPMPSRIEDGQELIDLCQSPFEKDVFTKLCDLGYVVRPQVPSMGRSIDLVVEGAGDSRLAVELDGDSYHGPEVWLEDWIRQKSLERIGWKFWRCWYSSYVADPDACIASLIERLESEKIYPQEQTAKIYQYTEFRVIGEAEEVEINDEEEPDTETIVEIGDVVVLSGNATSSGYVSARLVADRGNDRDMEFGPDHQVAQALLGRAVGDEVDLQLNGQSETKCIISLQKGTSESFDDSTPMQRAAKGIDPSPGKFEVDHTASREPEDQTKSRDRKPQKDASEPQPNRIPLKIAVPRAHKKRESDDFLLDFENETPDVEDEIGSSRTGRNVESLTAIEVQEALLEVLADCPNHSCTINSAPSRVLKFLGIRTRGDPMARFKTRLNHNIRALVDKGKVECYTATNRRIRLL